MTLRVVYIAHALNAPTEAGRQRNRANAAKWVAWLAAEFRIAPIADWVILASLWPETMRDRGIAIDLALIERADELWFVGPKISEGMRIEGDHALALGKPVRDIHGLGEPPDMEGDAVLRGAVAVTVGLP
jgi:hypothetical protein